MNVATIYMPYDDLVELVEDYCRDKGLVHDVEFIVATNLGVEVDENGKCAIDVVVASEDDEHEVWDISRDGEVVEVTEDNNVVDMSKYRVEHEEVE